MKIEMEEKLFLTNEEVKILQKAEELVSEIFYDIVDREIEELASNARDSLVILLQKSFLE